MGIAGKGTERGKKSSPGTAQAHGKPGPHARPFVRRLLDGMYNFYLRDTFAPSFLSGRLAHPAFGYLVALLLQVAVVITTLLLVQVFPSFRVQEELLILVILLVALGWGAGPSLVAYLVGVGSHVYCLLSSDSSLSTAHVENGLGIVLYLVVGFTVSMLASQSQRARHSAEVVSRHLEAVFEAITDGVAVSDDRGRIQRANLAFRDIFGLHEDEGALLSPPEMRGRWKIPRDLEGKRLPQEQWPLFRIMRGELLSGSNTMDMFAYARDGRDILLNASGAPITDESGHITGGVAVYRDVTERRKLEREIQEHAGRLQAIFEAMVDGVMRYDRDGRIVQINSSCRDLLALAGFPSNYGSLPIHERARQVTLLDGHGQPLPEDRRPSSRVLRGETLTGMDVVDLTFHAQDGREILMAVSGAPIRDADGQIIGGVIVFRDVTERCKLEREIQEHAGQLQAIFEAMVDGVTLCDREGRFVQMNTACRDFFALIGRPANYGSQTIHERARQFTLLDGHGQPLPEDRWPSSRVLRGETLTEMDVVDLMFSTQNGREIFIEESGAPVRDVDGQIIGGVMVFRDVTERRRLEDQVRQSEQRTRAELDALLAMAETLVSVNVVQNSEEELSTSMCIMQRLAGLACSVLGCQDASIATLEPETEVMQIVTTVGFTKDEERRMRENLQGASLRDRSAPEDLPLVTRFRMGEVITLDISRPPYRDRRTPTHGATQALVIPMRRGDRLFGLITLYRADLTCKYTSEEMAIAGALGKLAALVIERDRLLREREEARANELALRVANQQMDTFLGIASHELKTPLTTIKGNIQLARRRISKIVQRIPADDDILRNNLDELQEMLEKADRQANIQNRLVGDLLDVSRIQAGMLELHMAPCDLAAIVREALEDLRYAASNRTAHIDMTDVETVPIEADPDRIRQVINNYLTNALKYSAADRPIEMRLKIIGCQACVEVEDEGQGLSSEEQEQIWDRFYRAPGVTVQSGSSVGLGLGLHICRTIIEQHHGKVGVDSAPGKGSTFWFTLPMHAEHLA